MKTKKKTPDLYLKITYKNEDAFAGPSLIKATDLEPAMNGLKENYPSIKWNAASNLKSIEEIRPADGLKVQACLDNIENLHQVASDDLGLCVESTASSLDKSDLYKCLTVINAMSENLNIIKNELERQQDYLEVNEIQTN